MASSSNNNKGKEKVPKLPKHYPPTASIPTGYYLASKTPSEIVVSTPSTGTEQELDFNNFMYFAIRTLGKDKDGNIVEDFDVVDDDTLQKIFKSPESPWEDKLQDMVMVGATAKSNATFLSHYVDLYGKMDIRKLSDRLFTGRFQYVGGTKIVPKFLSKIIDPMPKLKFEGPIYQLSRPDVEVKVGCVTDALVVFHIDQPMSEMCFLVGRGYFTTDSATRFHGIRMSPQSAVEEHNLEVGSSVIVWNARHAARPSFKENFVRIASLHNPIAMLVTETRLYKKGVRRVMDDIETEMAWGVNESIGLGGGVVLFWDKERVKAQMDMTMVKDSDLRMVASVKPVGATDDATDVEAYSVEF